MATPKIPTQLAPWNKFVAKYRKEHPKDKNVLKHASAPYQKLMKAKPSRTPKRAKTPSRKLKKTPSRKTPSRKMTTPKSAKKTPSRKMTTPKSAKKTPSRKTPSRKTPKSALKKSKGTPRKCKVFRPKRCTKF